MRFAHGGVMARICVSLLEIGLVRTELIVILNAFHILNENIMDEAEKGCWSTPTFWCVSCLALFDALNVLLPT